MTLHLPITLQRVMRRVLSNGMVVVLCENQASASVALKGLVLAGAQFEEAGKEGLANLTATLMRRGTKQHSFLELNQILDNVGAALNLSADDNYMDIGGRALAADLPMLLDLTAEMLFQPRFSEEEFSKALGQLQTSLGMAENDTGYRASRAFSEALYPAGHPFARPSYGTLESVAALAVGDVRQYYEQLYHPATGVLVITGAIQPQAVLQQIERLFGGWSAAFPPPRRDVPMVQPPEGIVSVRVPLPEKPQADLLWGSIGVPRSSPDYYAARLANLVLGRLGMMGRLGNRIRDELGLAYYISSHLESGLGPIPWAISAGVNPANIDRTVAEINSEIERMRSEPISDQELADCRSYLIGSLPLGLETNGQIAEQIMAIEEYNLGYDYLERYPDIIQQVSQSNIQQVVAQHLDPQRYVFAVSGSF